MEGARWASKKFQKVNKNGFVGGALSKPAECRSVNGKGAPPPSKAVYFFILVHPEFS